jgi:hypothetical protein
MEARIATWRQNAERGAERVTVNIMKQPAKRTSRRQPNGFGALKRVWMKASPAPWSLCHLRIKTVYPGKRRVLPASATGRTRRTELFRAGGGAARLPHEDRRTRLE